MTAKITIRRTGTPSRPWEARCSACREERVHLVPSFGAVAVNTRGIGNRLWVLAMLAAGVHLRAHAICTGAADCIATDAHMLCCPSPTRRPT